jgi:hypothetical protein
MPITARTARRLSCTLLLLSGGAQAQAQTLQPGLWDMQTTMQGSAEMNQAMAEMHKQLAAMPPAQRQQMQDMMARQGVAIQPGTGGGMRVQICMTKEMVERDQIPTQDGQCKTQFSPRTGNTMKMRFTCTAPPSDGEGEVRFISPQAYSTRMTVNSQRGGKRETVTMQSEAKWLTAQCGAVRPLPVSP